MMESDIAGWIAGAQGGDAKCFDALIDAYAKRLYGYLYRLTGSQSDAEDLLQDLFVRLVGAIDRYEHHGHFDAFLFRMAINLYRDRIRKARRSRETVSLDVGESSEQIAVSAGNLMDLAGASPDQRLELAESADILQTALTALPVAEKDVIVLRHFSGMSFQDIAALMDTPVGTALARAHRGLAKLRDLMGDKVS